MPASEEEAERLHARHVLLLRLSALGLRPAVDDLRPAVPLGKGQAQHPRGHGSAPVQAAAAQRGAEGKPEEVWKPDCRRRIIADTELNIKLPPGKPGGSFRFLRGSI